MRKNKSQRDQRRSQLKANMPRLSTDPETGSIHLRHRVDMKTGMYRGRQVLDVTNDSQPTTNDSEQVAADDKGTETADAK